MIHVVLLAYNEEAGIAGFLQDLDLTLRRQNRPYRFVVVNDGSTDATAQEVESWAGRLPVTLLNHPTNLGVGRAFDTGLRHAAGAAAEEDVVISLEGDRTNDPACILEMLRAMDDGLDVVCASRYRPGGRYVGFPFKRLAFSIAANWSLRLLFPIPGVRDYTIFFRAYRARALAAAIRAFGDRFIEGKGFTANAELLYKVHQAARVKCGEVPVVYRYDLKRGPSKMKVWLNIREYGGLFSRLAKAGWQRDRRAP